MRFGVNFFPSARQEQQSAQEYFDNALSLAVRADELGFSHVRTVEHYFRAYGGMTPNPLLFLTAVAARTTRIRLVSGAVLPMFNHPIKIAGETAMLDAISKGRLDVGFGRAFLPEEFDAFQRSMDESRGRFEGGIAAVRRLWTERDVVYEDAFYRFGPVTSSPRPTQTPHPRILIAAVGTPQSFEWAGQQGFGMMVVPYAAQFQSLRDNLARYREAFATAHPGETPPPVQMSYHLHVAATDEEAVRESTAPMTQYLTVMKESASAWEGRSSTAYPGYAELMKELNALNIERIVREERAFIGSPATVRRVIESAAARFGDIEPSLSIYFGNMPYEAARQSIELFAGEVMPAFQ